MNIVFRVDAALHIGSGHVMRCLTLADELKKQGALCAFICRDLPGNLSQFIAQRGYAVHLLPAVQSEFQSYENQQVPHGHWLGVKEELDADETEQILSSFFDEQIDCLVIDHYALTRQWESCLRHMTNKIMVIDDLADRQHDCDILLDQTFGREDADYARLVPETAKLLLGSQYALIRNEFIEYRELSLGRHAQTKKVSHIIITMGGVDKDNCSELVLNGIAKSLLPSDCQITVVLGEKAPHLASVQQKSAELPWQVNVKTNVNNMAELMTSCDFAIGAAGTTTWERCVLGLPSIVITTAKNQEKIARGLSQKGSHWYIGDQADLAAESISSVVNHMVIDHGARYVLSGISQTICDGKGTVRVAKELLKLPVEVRLVTLDDAKLLHEWRNSDAIRKQSFNSQEILFKDHLKWLNSKLACEDTFLLISMVNQTPMGCVRFDKIQDIVEISVYLSPDYLGSGYGADVLNVAQNWLTCHKPEIRLIEANIKSTNEASKNVFEKANYHLNYYTYICKLHA